MKMGKPEKIMGEAARVLDLNGQRREIRKAETRHAERTVAGRMKPSAERERGATIVAQQAEYKGGTNHRVVSPLETYRERQLITTRQFNAGGALYTDWALGVCGVNDRDGGGSGSQVVGLSEAQLMALQSYDGAMKRLDRRQRELVLGVVCHENTIAAIAPQRADDPEELMKLLRSSLALLGDAYGMPTEAATETLRVTVRMPVTYQQAPDGSVEILSINGHMVGLRAADEDEAMKVALVWANEWSRKTLGVVPSRNARG